MRKKLASFDTSLNSLRAFSKSSRQEVGCRLDRIQQGSNPYNWKPFSIIDSGVREIHTRDTDGIYRVMYIAESEKVACILHCLQKETQTTGQSDVDLARRRYKELVQERKDES